MPKCSKGALTLCSFASSLFALGCLIVALSTSHWVYTTEKVKMRPPRSRLGGVAPTRMVPSSELSPSISPTQQLITTSTTKQNAPPTNDQHHHTSLVPFVSGATSRRRAQQHQALNRHQQQPTATTFALETDTPSPTQPYEEFYLNRTAWSGLWYMCVENPEDGLDEPDCFFINHFPNETRDLGDRNATLAIIYAVRRAARPVVASIVIFVLGLLCAIRSVTKKVCTFLAGVCIITAGLSLFIGIVLYISEMVGEWGTKLNTKPFETQPPVMYTFDFSFWAAVASLLFGEFAGLSFIFLNITRFEAYWANKEKLQSGSTALPHSSSKNPISITTSLADSQSQHTTANKYHARDQHFPLQTFENFLPHNHNSVVGKFTGDNSGEGNMDHSLTHSLPSSTHLFLPYVNFPPGKHSHAVHQPPHHQQQLQQHSSVTHQPLLNTATTTLSLEQQQSLPATYNKSKKSFSGGSQREGVTNNSSSPYYRVGGRRRSSAIIEMARIRNMLLREQQHQLQRQVIPQHRRDTAISEFSQFDHPQPNSTNFAPHHNNPHHRYRNRRYNDPDNPSHMFASSSHPNLATSRSVETAVSSNKIVDGENDEAERFVLEWHGQSPRAHRNHQQRGMAPPGFPVCNITSSERQAKTATVYSTPEQYYYYTYT